jgi:hypothetical protein
LENQEDITPFTIPKEEAQSWGQQALDIAIAARQARHAITPLIRTSHNPANVSDALAVFEALEQKSRQLLVEMTQYGLVPVDAPPKGRE